VNGQRKNDDDSKIGLFYYIRNRNVRPTDKIIMNVVFIKIYLLTYDDKNLTNMRN